MITITTKAVVNAEEGVDHLRRTIASCATEIGPSPGGRPAETGPAGTRPAGAKPAGTGAEAGTGVARAGTGVEAGGTP